ncbi:hypothetical protein [uncultured Thiodictyon sp.]|uniref:hypothetical protein n=1 Tax=uncultured Thiodictyon sp. TaxID=1846217 RepID=UPI0025E18844|nr:hypothetical protein [uncultured Thiodictyon sp.]
MSNVTAQAQGSANRGFPSLAELESRTRRADFWVFGAMLALALVGAGVSEVEEKGRFLWFYWFGVVLVYAGISVVRAWLKAKQQAQPVWPMIRTEVLHWLGALIAIKIILLFEATGITDRGAASVYSLLVLAVCSYLAGVHFDWTFMLLGGILAVIAVAIGFLDQMSVFLVVLPLSVVALWIVFRYKFAAARPVS